VPLEAQRISLYEWLTGAEGKAWREERDAMFNSHAD
jgi:hypothetical protein